VGRLASIHLEPWSIKLEVNLGNYDDGPGVKIDYSKADAFAPVI
jgi:hypothetical protein